MKISYNWLKWYIPEVPEADKLRDIFTYHLCEVESFEKLGDDTIFDINILPNRAHDLLSHQGIARELASLLDIKYNDPTPKYKVPESKPTNLKVEILTNPSTSLGIPSCRRYMGRIVRNVKVGPPPDWVKMHLESIGQRSINNIVDGANITMYDCGQPIHCFDLDKVHGAIIVRQALEGEKITTLDNKEVKLTPLDLVIADEQNVLAIAGVKGGKIAEVDENTKNIIIEVANFEPVSVRKTRRGINIFTDAAKRFENDLSPSLCDFGMLEMSGLLAEYGFTDFEDVVDIYPKKQESKILSFTTEKISRILGLKVSDKEIEDILKRYNFNFSAKGGPTSGWEINVPAMRLDLEIQEDMAEEIGRILGYEKVKPTIPKINFKPKVNETYEMIQKTRSYLLSQGYNEVMTYTFCNKGKVEVLESASDKKFLRTNLSDGVMDSVAFNSSMLPLLGIGDFRLLKLFEIGTIWNPEEKISVCYFYDKEDTKPKELSLEDFYKTIPSEFNLEPRIYNLETNFKMWSLFPFIVRDIAVWVPDGVTSEEVQKLIKNNTGELAIKGPNLFDEFKKDGKISYAFRTIFQSFDRTLTDAEINEIMTKVTNEINTKLGWQVR
jgi:phenylalanyl-tRNA synthetase beta subunit